MPDENARNAAEIAKVEAEREKLEIEIEEIRRRIDRVWTARGILQAVVAGLVTAALLAVWVIGYFEPLLTADMELAKRINDQRSIDLQTKDGQIKEQNKVLKELGDTNTRTEGELKQAREAIEDVIAQLEPMATETALPDDVRQKIADLTARFKQPIRISKPIKRGKTAVVLRKDPKTLSSEDIFQMVRNKGFSLPGNNIVGDFQHEFEVQERSGERVVIDYATALMWEQSGSSKTMTFGAAEAYIAKRNRDNFAGFSDWRLPTAEELISLVEPEQRDNGLYLDPAFDSVQRWSRTADMQSKTSGWGVVFYDGKIYIPTLDFPYYVRAVRSHSSI